MEVHPHVCRSDTVRFRFRATRICQYTAEHSRLQESLRNVISRKATVAHSVFSPSLNLSTLSSSSKDIYTFRIGPDAFEGAVVDGGFAVAAEDFQPENGRYTASHDKTEDDDSKVC